jgi:hypothetical protein
MRSGVPRVLSGLAGLSVPQVRRDAARSCGVQRIGCQDGCPNRPGVLAAREAAVVGLGVGQDDKRVPKYEGLFDCSPPDEGQPTRGAAFIAADSLEYAEQVLPTRSHFRRAVDLEVRRLKQKPSGFILAWNVYLRRKTGE